MNTRPWTKSYPPGARWDAPFAPEPLQSVLETSARLYAGLPALEFMGRRIAYEELDALANRAAAGFQKLGVGPGVHVGLYLPNTPHYVIAFFGVLKAGGVVVNYSPLDALNTLTLKVENSETDLLVTLDLAALMPQAEKLLAATRLKALVVGAFAEFAGAPGPVAAHMKAAGMLADVPADDRHVAFADLIANDGRYEVYPLGDLTEALAVIQYTGGTTGAPKGAMLSHANLTAACMQYVETSVVIEKGKERVLCVLPLFHIYALSAVLIMALRNGCEVILQPRFDAAAVVKDIVEKKVTIFPGVPTMHVALLSLPDIRKQDLSSLRYIGSGGAPLPVAVLQELEAIAGCRVAEGWGMSETSPAGTFTPHGVAPHPGSCGVPHPHVEMKFVDVTDPEKTLPLRESGEICIKGPNVTRGYWKSPAATQAAFTRDGYFRTGDVGYMDADGFVYIVDRTKDMLLCGGFNVYPRNIEEAVYQHPSVEEVSVIGVPDPYRGETPKAFVKLKAGAAPLTLDGLRTFLQDKLGKHEMIGALEIRPDLPKTPVGKISKKELRESEAQLGAQARQAGR